MKKSTSIRAGRHVIFQMHAHLVFVTKYRRAVFSGNMLIHLKHIFQDVCQDFESTLVEFNGESDHVHLLVHYPPKISISKLVNSLKGVSSRRLRSIFSKQITPYYWKGVLWSPSYFAGSCGGASIDMVKKYIQAQQHPKLR